MFGGHGEGGVFIGDVPQSHVVEVAGQGQNSQGEEKEDATRVVISLEPFGR